MADTSFDIIIIGSGPGGYVTAIRAASVRIGRGRRTIAFSKTSTLVA